jgi:peptide chain release factor subunit 3
LSKSIINPSHGKMANIVFIGHVDVGKSTISEAITKQYGDESTMCLDMGNELIKKKTVDVGKAFFSIDGKQFTILDAPGHRNYIPNMIDGLVQADLGILIVSAKKNEFEAGFEKGTTKEHLILAKAMGLRSIIVAINKIDLGETSLQHISEKLLPFLTKCGWKMPPIAKISGKDGNIVELIDILREINIRKSRSMNEKLILPIVDTYKDEATGTILSGIIKVGDKLMDGECKVIGLKKDGVCVEEAEEGDNVKVILKGSFNKGDVLCTQKLVACTSLLARVKIMDYNSIICNGFEAVMHLHTATVPMQIESIYSIEKKRLRFLRAKDDAILKISCSPCYVMKGRLARFLLRSGSKTVAMGKILKSL